MTYPQDPNPPATQPDTTVNGGSDFSGQPGRAYTPPTDTQFIADGKDTSNTNYAVDADGYDGKLDGPNSGFNHTGRDTSFTDGREASGEVVDTSYTETRDTTKGAYDADNGANDPVYRAPSPDAPGENFETSLTGARRTDVPDDNDPNSLPSGYSLQAFDTTGVGTRQGGPVEFTPPGAPTDVTATAVPGRREVVVEWTPGTPPVGAPVKRWLVQSNTQGSKIVPAHEHQTVMSEGLIGGDTYRFTVYAETDLGTGYRSAPSNPVLVSNADLTSDVDYVEDDRSPIYDPDGTFTNKPDET